MITNHTHIRLDPKVLTYYVGTKCTWHHCSGATSYHLTEKLHTETQAK